MKYKINEVSASLEQINFSGNITPHSWYKKITYENGRPDFLACALLSEIIYWYRPISERDPSTGETQYFKKYKEDLLQKSYADLEQTLGISKKQAQEALANLEKIGVLKRVFRTIDINGHKVSNVMFIEIFPDKIQEITFTELKKSISSLLLSDEGVTQKSLPHDLKVMTYTESTQKKTQKTTSNPPPLTPPKIDKVEVSKKMEEEEEDFSFLKDYNFSESQVGRIVAKFSKDEIQRALKILGTIKVKTSKFGTLWNILNNPKNYSDKPEKVENLIIQQKLALEHNEFLKEFLPKDIYENNINTIKNEYYMILYMMRDGKPYTTTCKPHNLESDIKQSLAEDKAWRKKK